MSHHKIIHLMRSIGAMLLKGVNGRSIRAHLSNSHHNHMKRHHHHDHHDGGSMIEPVVMRAEGAKQNSTEKRITPLRFRL